MSGAPPNMCTGAYTYRLMLITLDTPTHLELKKLISSKLYKM